MRLLLAGLASATAEQAPAALRPREATAGSSRRPEPNPTTGVPAPLARRFGGTAT